MHPFPRMLSSFRIVSRWTPASLELERIEFALDQEMDHQASFVLREIHPADGPAGFGERLAAGRCRASFLPIGA